MLEFQTAAELRAHYAAVHRRIYDAPKLIERKRARAEIALLMAEPIGELICGEAPVEEEQTSPQEPVESIFTCFDIIKATCLVWGITTAELLGESREQRLVAPRHIAIALACRFSSLSTVRIGQLFGGRDHSSCIHARRRMAPVIIGINLPADASAEDWVRVARDRYLLGAANR